MKSFLIKLLHLNGLKRFFVLFLVNKVYAGSFKDKHFRIKRKLLNSIGFSLGEGVRLVGPIDCAAGSFVIGKDTFVGKNFRVNGNGTVFIGENCDIAPEVTFQTGTHDMGTPSRRAGRGYCKNITVGNGTWIGVRSTILPGVSVGNSSVIGACSLVNKNVDDNSIFAGVPAKKIKDL